MQSINPATGKLIRDYAELSPSEVDNAIVRARDVFHEWRATPVAERAGLLSNAARVLRDGKADLAQLMTREMGKPIAQAQAEAEKCAWVCRYYAEHGAALPGRRARSTPTRPRATCAYDPLGPVLAVMPWNFPFWQVFRFAAPALMAGNVGLLKHADERARAARSPSRTCSATRASRRACFQHLVIAGREGGRRHRATGRRAVTLTGSERAGRAVGEAAGEALKKTVLELGGSRPVHRPRRRRPRAAAARRCVLADARTTGRAASRPSGSSWTRASSPTRSPTLFVERDGGAHASATRWTEDTDLGPLAREDLRDDAARPGAAQPSRGRRAARGRRALSRRRLLLPADGAGRRGPADAGVRARRLFGPVAALIDGRQRGATRCGWPTQSRFGLGASRLDPATSTEASGSRAQIESGVVFVNGMVKIRPAPAVRRHQGVGPRPRARPRKACTSSSTRRRVWIAG